MQSFYHPTESNHFSPQTANGRQFPPLLVKLLLLITLPPPIHCHHYQGRRVCSACKDTCFNHSREAVCMSPSQVHTECNKHSTSPPVNWLSDKVSLSHPWMDLGIDTQLLFYCQSCHHHPSAPWIWRGGDGHPHRFLPQWLSSYPTTWLGHWIHSPSSNLFTHRPVDPWPLDGPMRPGEATAWHDGQKCATAGGHMPLSRERK